MQGSKSEPELSVIIPTVGRMEILLRTLQELCDAAEGLNLEIIVVDDSALGGVELESFPGVVLLRSGGRGASFARNIGWRAAKAGLLLVLDDDILVHRANIMRTLELHASSEKVGYNFFWEYPEDLMKQVRSIKFGNYIIQHRLYSNSHRIKEDISKSGYMLQQGLSSQYFSIERKWIEAVDGYDKIPYAGIEDLLLFKKLRAIGVDIYLSPRDIVFQNEQNRLTVESIVNRYRTGALTRRIAVQMGHPEMGVQLSNFQKQIGKASSLIEPILKWVIRYFPYGLIYQKAVNARLSIATYRGFFKDPLPG